MALLRSSGKLNFMRVHDVGTRFGPPTDQIDVEVVVRLSSTPDNFFGFQLRTDGNRPVREGMLGLLRDAFNNNWTVELDYNLDTGKKHGVIIRTTLVK
jgi:hypothetical protein